MHIPLQPRDKIGARFDPFLFVFRFVSTNLPHLDKIFEQFELVEALGVGGVASERGGGGSCIDHGPYLGEYGGWEDEGGVDVVEDCDHCDLGREGLERGGEIVG